MADVFGNGGTEVSSLDNVLHPAEVTILGGGNVILKEEGFGVENVGVPPDIEVEQFPAEIAAGKDPQLDKAIEWVLGELKKAPEKKDQRPEFPIRVKKAG